MINSIFISFLLFSFNNRFIFGKNRL